MAKKKKRKNTKVEHTDFQVELIGILLILISIIGLCQFGLVGEFIKAFAGFLIGEPYALLLIIIAYIGGYLIIKRDTPSFISSRLIGLYLIVISCLTFIHLKYYIDFKVHDFSIIQKTIDNLLASIDPNSSVNLTGGGIIGGLVSLALVNLVTIQGTYVVCFVLILCGLILFTNISIGDFFVKIFNNLKQEKKPKEKKEKHKEVEITTPTNEYKEEEPEHIPDRKVVISSVDELIHVNNETGEVIEEVVEDDYTPNGNYQHPSINILNKPTKLNNKDNELAIKDNIPVLENVLRDFGIEGKIVAAHVGPSVTQYELEIKAGTKVSKILSIHREIALALAAKDVRIQAPIPGKKTIGIELPNKKISMVTVREILESVPKEKKDSKLLVTLGRDIMGSPQFCEINKTPHMLVAGSTGSGKSVCINSMITSILMRAKPDEVELSMYNGVPHLLTPVVTSPNKANNVLKKIVVEMENRYDLFEASGTKNIEGYNKYIEKKNENSDEKMLKLPFIVVIIDELADLMLVAAKEVEDSIMRITQMARAAGIHLIVATQRPSTDVITGVVKANIPSRISFAVSSSIDSRTILDMTGAEKLLGKGDMLFLPQGENTPIRIQGTFITDEEIKSVVDFTIAQQKAHYDKTFDMSEEEATAKSSFDGEARDADEEPLYNEIVEFVVTQGKASASLLQRRFRLGYNRAARVIDLLEERGIIGPNNGSTREVLVKLDKNDNE